MSMKNLSTLAIMAAIMGGGLEPSLLPEKIDVTPKEPIKPKGCKEYFFNKSGFYSTDKMLRSEVVFKCFASNDKNAKKKFNKFKETNL